MGTECTAVIRDPIDGLIVGLLLIGAVCLLIPFFERLTRKK